jgi:hypothetical protein
MSKSEALSLSFPYDWSNPDVDDETFIYVVLEKTIYTDIVKIMINYGAKKVLDVFNNNQWDPLTYKILSRMISNAKKGLACD